jgi:hypothetical protein
MLTQNISVFVTETLHRYQKKIARYTKNVSRETIAGGNVAYAASPLRYPPVVIILLLISLLDKIYTYLLVQGM